MSAFHLHINIIERRSPIRLFEPFEPLFFLGRVSACGETGVTPCRQPALKNPHPACRAHDDHRMMSRPLVSTIATVDRADAPKSNQEGEEKSGLSY
jgi:hypothetical protein